MDLLRLRRSAARLDRTVQHRKGFHVDRRWSGDNSRTRVDRHRKATGHAAGKGRINGRIHSRVPTRPISARSRSPASSGHRAYEPRDRRGVGDQRTHSGTSYLQPLHQDRRAKPGGSHIFRTHQVGCFTKPLTLARWVLIPTSHQLAITQDEHFDGCCTLAIQARCCSRYITGGLARGDDGASFLWEG